MFYCWVQDASGRWDVETSAMYRLRFGSLVWTIFGSFWNRIRLAAVISVMDRFFDENFTLQFWRTGRWPCIFAGRVDLGFFSCFFSPCFCVLLVGRLIRRLWKCGTVGLLWAARMLLLVERLETWFLTSFACSCVDEMYLYCSNFNAGGSNLALFSMFCLPLINIVKCHRRDFRVHHNLIHFIGGAFRAAGGFSQPAIAAESASQPLRRNPGGISQPATAAESASQPASYRGGISQPAADQPASHCGGISQPASQLPRRNQPASGGSASQPLRRNQPASHRSGISQPATAPESASQPPRRNQPASQPHPATARPFFKSNYDLV